MLFTHSIAALLATASFATADWANAGDCARICIPGVVRAALAKFGCIEDDYDCYCSNGSFVYGVRDCANQNDCTQKADAITYATDYCLDILGQPASNATAASQASAVQAEVSGKASLPVASIASVDAASGLHNITVSPTGATTHTTASITIAPVLTTIMNGTSQQISTLGSTTSTVSHNTTSTGKTSSGSSSSTSPSGSGSKSSSSSSSSSSTASAGQAMITAAGSLAGAAAIAVLAFV